jgi:hypothetical protein
MIHKHNLLFLLPLLCLSWAASAAGVVHGTVVDAQTKEPLPGVTVVIDGTAMGSAAGLDGSFSLTTPGGNVSLTFRCIGYKEQTINMTVAGAGITMETVEMERDVIELQGAVVTANVAIRRKTPVALSVVSAEDIEEKLSNKEFPEILKNHARCVCHARRRRIRRCAHQPARL